MSPTRDELDMLFDGYDDDEHDYGNITCRRCKAPDLHWEEARGEHNEKRWVLMEADDSIHCCPDAGPAGADEFPTEA